MDVISETSEPVFSASGSLHRSYPVGSRNSDPEDISDHGCWGYRFKLDGKMEPDSASFCRNGLGWRHGEGEEALP